MRHNLQFFFVAVLTVFTFGSPASVQAQAWQTTGPNFGSTLRVAVHPTNASILYTTGIDSTESALSSGALYKTTDAGQNWFSSSSGIPASESLTAIAVAPNNANVLYVGTTTGVLYRSADAGGNWSLLTDPDAGTGQVLEIAIRPDDENRLYVSIQDGSVSSTTGSLYRTQNAGTSWSKYTSAQGLPAGIFGSATLLTGLTYNTAAPYDTLYVGAIPIFFLSTRVNYAVYRTNAANAATPAFAAVTSFNISGADPFNDNLNVNFSLASTPAAVGTYYGGFNGQGYWKTGDGGASWNSINGSVPDAISSEGYGGNGPTYYFNKDGLRIKPSQVSSTRVFYGHLNFGSAGGNGVYLSNDGGASVGPAHFSLDGTFQKGVTATDIALTNVREDTIYFANVRSGGIYRSTNGGSNWSLQNGGLAGTKAGTLPAPKATIVAVQASRSNNNLLYALTAQNGMAVSFNGGADWIESNGRFEGGQPSQNYLPGISQPAGGNVVFPKFVGSSLAVSATNQAKVYVGISDQVGGIANAGVYLSTADLGFSLTYNYGFRTASSGLPNAGPGTNIRVQSLFVSEASDATVFAGMLQTTASNGGLWRSQNSGGSWTRVSPPALDGTTITKIDGVIGSNTLYIGTTGGGVYRSTNITAGSPTFTAVNAGLSSLNITALSVSPLVSTNLFVATGDGRVWESLNGGDTWTDITGILSVSSIFDLRALSDRLLAATNGGVYVYATGLGWTPFNSGLFTTEARALSNLVGATGSERLWVGTAATATVSGAVYRANLIDVPLPVELISFTATASEKGVELQWQTASETDNQSWLLKRRKSGEIVEADVATLAGGGTLPSGATYNYIDQTTLAVGQYDYNLYVVSKSGTISEEGTVSVEVKAKNPTAFGLSQNYPNPFNPVTTVRYELPVKSDVSLKVFDMLGRTVATLVSERKDAGAFEVKFDGSKLSSGIYFYRLQTASERGSFVSVKKMMLVK